MYQQNSIGDEIKETFRKGSSLTKLIYINLGIFLLVNIGFIVFVLFHPDHLGIKEKAGVFTDQFLYYLMVPTNLEELLKHFWAPFTYMFLHFSFLHILFNLLWLFWFGRIFLKYLNEKQLLTTYILGGLSGAALFIIFYNIFPGLDNASALGASAAIMSIVFAISFYNPNYEVYLLFFGAVKIKHIAVVYIIIDVFIQLSANNFGGYITHVGGAAYGYLFALQLKKGKDMGKGFSRFMDVLASLFRKNPKLKVAYKNQTQNMTDFDYNKSKAEAQKEVDRILDKIAQSGYDSLTKKEKELLFKMSGKN